MMPASAIFFYVLAALILVSAVLSVTSRKIFRSAIWLLFSLIGIAGIYFWLDMNFLAAVQIIVYVGGIVVLIIFSVFLTQGSGQTLPFPSIGRLFFAGLICLSGLGFSIWSINKYGYHETATAADFPGIKQLGKQMLSVEQGGYALPFEAVSILLLAAMIASIVIALKKSASQ